MSELNNWLQCQEDEEFERFKAEKGDKRQTKAAMLAGLGLAASLGAVAVNADEAKADEQGQEVHDLLLCARDSGDKPVETIVTDPQSLHYNSYPSNWDDPENILSASAPRFWNGYVFKPFSNYVAGTSGWRIFKMVNGEEIDAGQLPDVISGYMDVISQDAGLINGSDGNFYRLIDIGNTVTIELVGEAPLMPDFSYGGYLFSKYSKYGSPTHDEEAVIIDEDNPTEIASVLTIAIGGTSFNNSGCNVDKQTGELIMTAQNGYRVAQLPLLVDGKLPPDFSLNDLTFGPIIPLGPQIIDKVIAGYGYKYFFSGYSDEIVIMAPGSQKYVISGTQFGMTNISRIIGLNGGGAYAVANGDLNLPPVSIIPTSDPTKFIAPGVPFEKIFDEPTNVTQHIIDDGCVVVPQEYHDEFEPISDPCADVTCPPSAEQCKEAVCDSQTGDCEETAKPNGTTCDADANACTVGDACADGQCAPGAPKTCEEPVNPNSCMKSDGCNPETGWCSTVKKPAETPCDDENSDTKDDKCNSQGQCVGTPIVDPEPDVVEPEVEPSPESDDVDVVEQGEDIQDDSVEPNPETEPDVAEQDNDSSDAVDAVEADQELDSTETEPEADVAEQEPDVKIDASVDASEDLAEDGSGDNVEQETGVDSSEDDTISADADPQKKAPGCGCDAGGGTPNTANSTLLLGLGLALTGAVARFRNRIRSVLASRE